MHNCRPRRQPTPAFRVVRHDALKSNASSIQFGLKDLVLTGDLTACSSELENSYGIGLAAGSEDAKVRACVPECITYAPFLHVGRHVLLLHKIHIVKLSLLSLR